MKRAWILCAAVAACAPRANRAVPTVVLTAPRDTGAATPPADPAKEVHLARLSARLDDLRGAADRPRTPQEPLTKLAEIVASLGFPREEGVLTPPELHRVLGGQIYPVNLDRDAEPEYVVTLEARYEDPNAGSGDLEPSGYLYVAWLDGGPGGLRVVGRHSLLRVEGGTFNVRFEPVHDPAFADTILETNWSVTVNAASSGQNLVVATLERGKLDILATEACGSFELTGRPPKTIACDKCIPVVYAFPPGAVPCPDASKPTLVWDAPAFRYRTAGNASK